MISFPDAELLVVSSNPAVEATRRRRSIPIIFGENLPGIMIDVDDLFLADYM
jgi:hypothetical protein